MIARCSFLALDFGPDALVKNVCLLNFPEAPPLPQVVVTERGDDEIWKRNYPIMWRAIDFSRDLAWIWGYVIGLKCLIIGIVFVSRGFIEWRECRQGEQSSRHQS